MLPKGTQGSVSLSAGYHRIFIRHREHEGPGYGLNVYYKVPSVTTSSWAVIPFSRFYYDLGEQNLLTTSERFFNSCQISSWVSLNNDALNDGLNRGRWQNGATYKVGEYVYIENTNIKVAKKNIKENRRTAISYSNIASLHNDKGDYDKAILYFNKALQISQKNLGNNNQLDISIYYNNIASS